jgi:hypothetical protein
MRIQAEPTRVLPITLHAEILRRIIAGRVRTIHQANKRYARLEPGDALWVREGMLIPRHQSGGDLLSVVYGGDGTRKDIHWPRVIARPSEGKVPPNGMPVHASRVTLIVTSVREMRLQQISETSAIAAGVDIDLGGFSNPLRHNQVFEHAAEAFGRMWDCALDTSALTNACWTVNPEVVEIGIRAVARNVADLVSGLGSGGVR